MIQDKVFYLLDIDETPLRALPLSAEYKLEDLQDSTNRIEVRLPYKESGEIKTDQDIVFRGRRFTIFESGLDKETGEIILICDEIQTRLTDVNIPAYVLKDNTLPEAMTKAVEKAAAGGWSVGDVFETNLNYNAELKNASSLFALRFLERQSGGRLSFDSGKKKIHMIETGQLADVVFRYGKNVSNIEKTQTSPQATVLFAYGRDGMTIEALTGGKKFVEDFSWYTGLGMKIEDARKKFTKELVWEDDRYIYNANLYRDAVTRLGLLSQPQINYKLTNANAEGVELGMRAYVADEELGIRVLVAVTKLIRSSTPGEDEIELDYIRPSLGATLDNEYSGDTNTGQSGETSFFVQKNQSAFTVSDIPAPIISADITVYSSTAFEMGVTLMIEVTGGGLLEGYFTMDGERLPVEIKQTVAVGWYTIGLPFIVTGIQEGTKTLRFYLTMATGSANVAKERAEFYVKASGVYGGDSNAKPDQTIVEDVEANSYPAPSVSDSGIEFRDLPRRFAAVENVTPLAFTAPAVTEYLFVVGDPPFGENYNSAPSVPREQFALMSNYSTITNVMTQEQADSFIDYAHYEKLLFKVVTIGTETVYLIVTTGTFIVVDEFAKLISSDGEMYTYNYAHDVDYRGDYQGRRIEWATQTGALDEMETYDRAASEVRVPGYIYGYGTAAGSAVLDYDELRDGDLVGNVYDIFPGSTYHITRSASDTFNLLPMEREPLLTKTDETFNYPAEAQDVAILELDYTAPAAAEYLYIQLSSSSESPDLTITETARPITTGANGEKYSSGYTVTAGSNILSFEQPEIGKAAGVSYPVTGGAYYNFDKNAPSDAFKVLFMNAAPLYDGADQTVIAEGQDIQDSQGITLQAPADAVAVFIQYTMSGQPSPVVFTETTEPAEPIDPTERTRENYAVMSNYPDVGTKATQSYVDNFIDSNLANFARMNVFRSDDYNALFLTAANGTYIAHDGAGQFHSDAPFRLINESRTFNSSSSGGRHEIGAGFNWYIVETLKI